MSETMKAAFLPGNSTVELRNVPVPEPGHGEVLLAVKASTICGSDIRAIYHEHLGKGPEGYQGVIAGHEPSGQIVATGPGCRRFKVGDRVIVYHISGCGVCNDCRRGYMISCTTWPSTCLLKRRTSRLAHLPGRGAGRVRIWHGLRSAPESGDRRRPRSADYAVVAGFAFWGSRTAPHLTGLGRLHNEVPSELKS